MSVENSSRHPDEEAAYQPPHYPYVGNTHRSRRRSWLLIVLIAIAVILAGVITWFFMHRHPAAKPATQATTATTPAVTTPVSTAPQQFKSTTLNIAVTYPGSWTLKESSDKKEMRLTSPQTTYPKAAGGTTTGVFTVEIREDVPDAMQATIQHAVAAVDSTVIAYDQPTSAQRQYTNLSIAGTNATTFNFLMLTGSSAYKAGDPFGTGLDLTGTAYLIAGGYGADNGDALAFDGVPKAAYDSAAYEQAVAIVKSLQIY